MTTCITDIALNHNPDSCSALETGCREDAEVDVPARGDGESSDFQEMDDNDEILRLVELILQRVQEDPLMDDLLSRQEVLLINECYLRVGGSPTKHHYSETERHARLGALGDILDRILDREERLELADEELMMASCRPRALRNRRLYIKGRRVRNRVGGWESTRRVTATTVRPGWSRCDSRRVRRAMRRDCNDRDLLYLDYGVTGLRDLLSIYDAPRVQFPVAWCSHNIYKSGDDRHVSRRRLADLRHTGWFTYTDDSRSQCRYLC